MGGRGGASGDKWIETFVPYRLYRATNKLNAKLLGKLRGLRINPSQWRVLSLLKAYGTLQMGSIIELALMEQSTVSRVVAQLEKKGQVTRRASTVDARVIEVRLTRKGAEAFNEIIPTALRHQEIAFRGFTECELALLVDMLARLENNIEAYE